MGLEQSLLALAFGAGTHQIGLYSFLASLCCRNLRLCLIDSRERLLNASVLQLALAKVVLDGSFGSIHRRIRLSNLRLIVIVLQLNQEVSLVHLLIIGDSYVPDNPGNLGTEWRE